MTDETRAWLLERRDAIRVQIVRLQAREKLLLELLAELSPDARTRAGMPMNGKIVHKTVIKGLHAAGERGLTANELARLSGASVATAASRLSIAKAAGYATLKNHRYIVVHSEQQDNNQVQGGEP